MDTLKTESPQNKVQTRGISHQENTTETGKELAPPSLFGVSSIQLKTRQPSQFPAVQRKMVVQKAENDLISEPAEIAGLFILSYTQAGAFFRYHKAVLSGERTELSTAQLDIPDTIQTVMVEADERISLYEGGGEEPITEGIVTDLRTWHTNSYTPAYNAIQAVKARRALEDMRTAQRQLEETQRNINEVIVPQLRESQRVAFRSENNSQLQQFTDTLFTAIDTGLNIRGPIEEIIGVMRELRGYQLPGRTVLNIENTTLRVFHIVDRINRVYATFQLLQTSLGLLTGTPVTEAAGGRAAVGAMATVYSAGGTLLGASSMVSLHANLYIGPLTARCMELLGQLEDSIAGTERHYINFDPDVINWSVQPGGRAMYDFIIQVMHARNARGVPHISDTVYNYFDGRMSSFDAGSRFHDIPEDDDWFYPDVERDSLPAWVYANRQSIWNMLYGDVPVPR